MTQAAMNSQILRWKNPWMNDEEPKWVKGQWYYAIHAKNFFFLKKEIYWETNRFNCIYQHGAILRMQEFKIPSSSGMA